MTFTTAGPASERLRALHSDASVGAVLEAEGFSSALEIAHYAPGHFVAKVAPALGGDEQLAREVHAKATQVRSAVMHLWANVHSAVRSPHFNALLVANLDEDAKPAFNRLPSYEELFGTLDYCECDECQSVFGPSAYLVDLLRVIDTYITNPNATVIPVDFRLDHRRPDIGELPLTCANANDTFPLLRVVNERLSAEARKALKLIDGDDLFERLTRTTHPFNLPFDLSWERLGLALGLIGGSVIDVYRNFGASPADVARARLRMPVEELAFVTTSLAAKPVDLAASYGVDQAALPGLGSVPALLAATGLVLPALQELLAQHLSVDELTAGVATGFFINGGLGGKWLTYVPGKDKTPATIGNFAVDPVNALDRLSRFVRLAIRLGWDATRLDWALRVVGGGTADITPATVTALAGVIDAAAATALDVESVLALVGPVKPYGAGLDAVSAAPFDRIFNAPSALAGRAPFHPATPLNPLYTDAPFDWTIGDTTPAGQQTSAWLSAAVGVPLGPLGTLARALWGTKVSVTFDALSALYRHALLLRTLHMDVASYVTFMSRAGYVADGRLTPAMSVADVQAILAEAAWLARSGLTVPQVDYFLGGPPGPTIDPRFVAGAVPTWLTAVRQSGAGQSGQALLGTLLDQVASLFGVAAEVVETLHPLVLQETQPAPADFAKALMTPPADDKSPPPYLDYVLWYLTWTSRWIVLTGALSVSPTLLHSVASNPDAYGFARPRSPASVRWLATFQRLVALFGDTAGRLMAFVDPMSQNPAADATAQLVAATGWDPAQTAQLLAPFAAEKNRVLVLDALTRQFGTLGTLGADPAFATRLVTVTTDRATSWAARTAFVDLAVAKVRASVADGQWPALAQQLEGSVDECVRKALVPLVLGSIHAKHAEIAHVRNLSEYLLVDVETSAVVEISRVREALNAAQIYLQRCRLRLEPIEHLEIPEVWWEWLMGYRIWQANREIYLYPENYYRPSLRKAKTPLYATLESDLQQREVTDEAVDDTYRTYVDGLGTVADLDIVDAYRCTVSDPRRGPVDTTFLFARTATDPYRYYVNSYDTGVWSSWKPIDVTIAAPWVTPVYVFNHLFLFWVELAITKTADLPGNQGGSTRAVTYTATIKYSFTDFNDRWIQPQSLTSNAVVYYMPTETDTTGALAGLKSRADLFQMDNLYWSKVGVSVVGPPSNGNAPDPSQQKLVVLYGPFLEKDVTAHKFDQPTAPPPAPLNETTDAAAFAREVFNVTTSYNELVDARAYGYMPVADGFVLDEQLNHSYMRRSNEVLVLDKDFREETPPLFRAEVQTTLGSLAIVRDDSAYVAGYLSDYQAPLATARPAVVVTAASLVTDRIGATTAQAVFAALTTHELAPDTPVVGKDGLVSRQFAANTDLAFLMGTAGLAEAAIPDVRRALLGALGDPTILSEIPPTTAQLVAVKNQPGSFLFSTGDETFLLTPQDVCYAQLSEATAGTMIRSRPLVFQAYFEGLTGDTAEHIFLDLVGNNIVSRANRDEKFGTLTPSFDQWTSLSFLGGGVSSPEQARLITEVRHVLLALPTLTLLTYAGNGTPRFVTESSFTTTDISAADSAQVFKDLIFGGTIAADGKLQGAVGLTTNLSYLSDSWSDKQIEEIRSVLMTLPKFVPPGSFAGPLIDPSASQAAFAALTAHQVLDANGAVVPSFGPKTDLSFLFPESAEPLRDRQIAAVRAVLRRFFDSTYRIDVNELGFDVERVSARASERQLSYALFAGGIDAALSLRTQAAPVAPVLPFSRLGPDPCAITPPKLPDGVQIDFDGPYGLYFWELFFHAPLLVATMLATNQQYAAAKRWLEYVLNPTVPEQLVDAGSFATQDISSDMSATAFGALLTHGVLDEVTATGARVNSGWSPATPLDFLFTSSDPVTRETLLSEVRAVLGNFQLARPASHYWQFRPFRNRTLESLRDILTDPVAIRTYNDDPFDPDAICRLRIGGYEKATLMMYIDTLLSWGDMLFTEYTWESVSSAALLYMYAEDLLGDRPVDEGPCPPPPKALSFDEIKAKYGPGHIPQFLIDLEHWLAQSPSALPTYQAMGDAFNALDAYFCAPENRVLSGYWDRVEDRLTKIRSGMNIDGVALPLALYDPPIDPMALVRAAASGGGFLGAAGGSLPKISSYYRFRTLHDAAEQLTALVTELGGSLLAALEKKDASALDLLRATQERTILEMTSAIKQRQIVELQRTIESLTLSRDRSQFQVDHYAGLVDGGHSAAESASLVLAAEAIIFEAIAAPIRGIAVYAYAIPTIYGLADGGMQPGEAVNSIADLSASLSNTLQLSSGLVASEAEFARRSEEWAFQQEVAKRDVDVYDKQIAAAQVQLAAAEQDLVVHRTSIAQSAAVATALASRFTNAQLYQWMADRLAAVYFQAYSLAVATARDAELAFQYELNSDASFVQLAYWDNLHRGLTAGETLAFSLTQMKKAYLDAHNRKLEIEKTISLAQLDPQLILGLRAGKPASFKLSEALFDFDFPGHYARQIATVSVSIPAVVGPYQNINATLRQDRSFVVTRAEKELVAWLVEREKGTSQGGPPLGIRPDWLSQQEIAISRGMNDSGVFELSFGGDQYLPFEGTGAVSDWTLSIPPETNRIDLTQLTDVVIELRYTALDRASFRADVISVLNDQKVRYPGRLYLDTRAMFGSAWSAFMQAAPNPATQTLAFDVTANMLPYLRSVRLDTASVKIDLKPEIKLSPGKSFVTLTIGAHSYPLDFKQGIALTEPALDGPGFLAPWTLTVRLADAPPPLKDAMGRLNPSALLDFELILSYSADVFGSNP